MGICLEAMIYLVVGIMMLTLLVILDRLINKNEEE